MPKKPFKHANSKPTVSAKAPETPKANFSDELLTYSCGRLSSVCTYVLRQKDMTDEAVREACGQAIICTAVVSSHFQYYDSASLADRTAALQNMAACCESLITALTDKEFEGSLDLLTVAQNCLEQCKETSGEVTEEQAEEASEGTVAVPATAKAAKKVSAKRRNPNWLIVKAEEAEDGQKTYSVTIDGVIGESIDDDTGVASTEFKNALAKIPKGSAIDLYVKSPGGSCLGGYDIYQALRDRKDDVTVHVVAALSIASVIALGGGRVLTSLASQWMIHAPLAGTYGNEEDHQDSIKMLKSFGSTMADVYAAHTGMSKDACLAMMEETTWFTGKEAVEMGFADAIDEDANEEEVQEINAKFMDACEKDTDSRYAVSAFYKPISRSTSAAGVTGIAASNSKNKTETMSEKAATSVTAAATPPANDFQKRFLEERKARITAEVTRRSENRVKNENLQFWVDAALRTDTMEDEQKVYAQIETLPEAKSPGGAALPSGAVVDTGFADFLTRKVNASGQIIEIGPRPSGSRLPFAQGVRALKTPQQRVEAYKRDWSGMLAYCIQQDEKLASEGRLPVASNTYSATLIADNLTDGAITVLQNRWATLSAFTREFGVDRYKMLADGVIRFVTGGATALKGTKTSPITNYETAAATVRAVSVPMTHVAVPFSVSQDDLMSGQRLEHYSEINLGVLSDTVLDIAMAPISSGGLNTSGNKVAYSAGTYHAIASTGTFGWDIDMPRLRGYIQKSPIKNAILDGVFYSFLANQPAFFQAGLDGSGKDNAIRFGGWSNIQENSRWPGVTGNNAATLAGFICGPSAIGIVAGLPMQPPTIQGNTLTETVIFVPGPDIYIALYSWFSLGSRSMYASFDVVAGASGGDATAGALLFNGAGPRTA